MQSIEQGQHAQFGGPVQLPETLYLHNMLLEHVAQCGWPRIDAVPSLPDCFTMHCLAQACWGCHTKAAIGAA